MEVGLRQRVRKHQHCYCCAELDQHHDELLAMRALILLLAFVCSASAQPLLDALASFPGSLASGAPASNPVLSIWATNFAVTIGATNSMTVTSGTKNYGVVFAVGRKSSNSGGPSNAFWGTVQMNILWTTNINTGSSGSQGTLFGLGNP